MTCKWKVFCEQGDTCVAHNGYDILKCTAFKDKGVPMTEQEWIQTCTTEQLVRVIHLMTTSCYVCGKEGVDYKRCYFHKKCTGPKEIEEWLKEPHTPFP
jgi:hypothetical protein